MHSTKRRAGGASAPNAPSPAPFDKYPKLDALIELRPIAALDDNHALIKLSAACHRAGVRTATEMAHVIACAGGIVLYAAGETLFVNPAAFHTAVTMTKNAGAL